MINKEEVTHVVFRAIDEVNQLWPSEKQLDKSLDVVLYGREGRLDSLAFVNLILTIEQRINSDLGVSITLADERAMSEVRSPFRTIGTLVEYILVLLEAPSF